MKIYSIDILPIYKSFEEKLIKPSVISPIYDSQTGPYIDNTSTLSQEHKLITNDNSNIDDFYDNDDIEFVRLNMEQGQYAEDYIKDLMIKKYNNCFKVKAKEGYDFKIEIDKKEFRLEVKSIQSYNSPFHITINELDHAIDYEDSYYLCFVVLPSIQVGVKDVKFLENPIKNLDIRIPLSNNVLNQKCVILPEKFLVIPNKGFIRGLRSTLV